jgi:ElaB/YqjD/DUF883 family membrane-anchored ribosome-binding protein
MPTTTRRRKTAAGAAPQDGDLQAALEQLRDDLEALQRDVKNLAGEAGGAASDKINEALATALGTVESLRDRAESWGEANLDTVRDTVREQPLQSCMVAFGIGALIGAILRR